MQYVAWLPNSDRLKLLDIGDSSDYKVARVPVSHQMVEKQYWIMHSMLNYLMV